MKNLTPFQVANFTQWLLESNTTRMPEFILNSHGKVRIAYIETVLLPRFLSKYPNGILTGWVN
jgi:hypothetical protein